MNLRMKRISMKKIMMSVVVLAILAGSIQLPGNVKVARATPQNWTNLVTAQATKDENLITSDTIISFNDILHVEYKVGIESLGIIASATGEGSAYEGVHTIGQLNPFLDASLISTDPIVIDSGEIKIGEVKFDSTSKNFTFEFDPALKRNAPDKSILDIEFEFDVKLNISEIADRSEINVNFAGGNGTGTEIKVKENQEGPATAEKTGGTYDSTNGIITWNVTVTSHGQAPDGGITIKDTLPTGLTYFNGTLPDGTTVHSTVKEVVGGVDGTASNIDFTKTGNVITYDYTPSTDFTTKNNKIVFTYVTKVADSLLTGDLTTEFNANVSNNVTNNAQIYKKGTDDLITSATDTVTVTNTLTNWMTKKHGTVNVSGDIATIPWEITVNLNGFYDHMDNLALHDELEYKLQYKLNSAKYIVNGKKADGTSILSSTEKTFSPAFSTGTAEAGAVLNGADGQNLKALINDAKAETTDMATVDSITIKYDTTFDGYNDFRHSNQDEPKNKAWLTYKWKDYYGVDGTSFDFKGPDLSKGAGISSSVITKEGSYDASTKKITWTITFNQNAASLNNVTIEDKIGAGQEYLYDTATSISGSDFTSKPGANVSEGGNATFGFGNVTTQTSFSFETKLIDSEKDFFANNATEEYVNDATLIVDGTTYDTKHAVVNATSKVLGKESLGFDYSTNEIRWKINVNENLMALNNVEVKDELQVGTSLVEGTGKLEFFDYIGDVSAGPSKEIVKNGVTPPSYTYSGGVLTVELEDFDKGHRGEIYYSTMVDVNASVFSDAFFKI